MTWRFKKNMKIWELLSKAIDVRMQQLQDLVDKSGDSRQY